MTSIWSGDSIVPSSANADNTILQQQFVGSAGVVSGGNTVFTLTNFTYQIETGSLDVYIDGVFQKINVDFEETTNTTFTVIGLLGTDTDIVAVGRVGGDGSTAAAESAAAAAASAVAADASADAAEGFADDAETSAIAAAASAAAAAVHLMYLVPVVRNSDIPIVVGDAGKRFLCTGTFTQTLTAAGMTAGFAIRYKNNSAEDSGSEITITTDTRTYKIYPREERIIYWNAADTRFDSMVLNAFYLKQTTTLAAWTPPPGYTEFPYEMWNGGSSGQRTNSLVTEAYGGGGGGHFIGTLLASTVGTADITLTVGDGGAAVVGVADGNPGGVTSIGSFITMTVNSAGNFYKGSSVNGAFCLTAGGQQKGHGFEGGASVSPGINDAGIDGLHGGGGSATREATTRSGNSILGGAAGGYVGATGVIVPPGTSQKGGNGGAAATNTNGTAGVAPGGGGGATQTGAQSGPGARGEIRLTGRPG